MGFCRQGWLQTGLMAFAVLASAPVLAAEQVRIAAVHFPPYAIKPEQELQRGLSAQLVEALNQVQSDYQFVLRATSLKRRFKDFEQGRYDLALFENPDWRWQGIVGHRIEMGLEDAEVLVARAEPARDQGYFSNLTNKRLALFNGYHYGFAGFNNDPQWLTAHFNAQLTYSHESNLEMVLRGRADVAPITRSWLSEQLRTQPQLRGQLLISEWEDQHYRHYAILRQQAPISAERLREVLQAVRDNGQMQRIFSPYGIAVSSRVAGSSTVIDGTD